MADNIIINTGTGSTIVTDQIGTAHYQVIKIALGSADTAAMLPVGQQAMAASLPVAIANNQSTLDVAVVSFTPAGTQDVEVVNTPTVTVSNNPLVVTAANITVASVTAATVSTVLALPVVVVTASANPLIVSTVSTVLTMPVLSATNVTIASVATIATGTVSVVAMPVLSATNVTIASIATGTMTVANILQYTADATVMNATAQGMVIMGMQSGATTGRSVVVTTTGGLVIGAMPAVGGGAQYQDGTIVNETGTGTLLFGVSNNSARSILIHTTGGLIIQSMPAVGGGQQYSVGNTDMGATGTGTMIIGLQSGATTGRALALTVTGAAYSYMEAGTLTTVLAMPVLSATNVTIASVATIATGSVSIVNTPAVVCTAHGSKWDAYAVCTTSGAGLVSIVKVSGAHTLYITDVMVSVDVPMAVTLYSSTGTAKSVVYLATKGGFALSLQTPMVLNSAQSLCFQGNASGSVSCFAAGYTVT